mgnify:CR=1 FL=1|tara:strand:- start:7152 stop:7517 length:366 start_codon:yes stop_codon:yes gene_type:complete
MKVFVYGTLKNGGVGHIFCDLQSQTFIGEATVSDMALFLVSGVGFNFPAMTHGAGRVSGEVYEIDAATFGSMCRFEGRMYHPLTVETTLGPAETFLWSLETDDLDSAPLLDADIQYFPLTV